MGLGGALLAPILWAGGQWAIANGLLPSLRPFGFPKYLNRALMGLALLGLWPLLVQLGLNRGVALGLRSNPARLRHLGLGLAFGLGGLGLMGAALCSADVLVRHSWPRPLAVAQLAGAALLVACLEELLFRAALLGALRQRLSTLNALAVCTGLFALVHFIQPNPALPMVQPIDALAGLRLLPHLLWQLGEPSRIATSFLTLVCVGLSLGLCVLRSQSLMAAIGLHAGWILGLRALQSCCHLTGTGWWLSADWRGGLAPTLLVVLTTIGLLPRIARAQ